MKTPPDRHRHLPNPTKQLLLLMLLLLLPLSRTNLVFFVLVLRVVVVVKVVVSRMVLVLVLMLMLMLCLVSKQRIFFEPFVAGLSSAAAAAAAAAVWVRVEATSHWIGCGLVLASVGSRLLLAASLLLLGTGVDIGGVDSLVLVPTALIVDRLSSGLVGRLLLLLLFGSVAGHDVVDGGLVVATSLDQGFLEFAFVEQGLCVDSVRLEFLPHFPRLHAGDIGHGVKETRSSSRNSSRR
mmetsp:Transcript_18472/g.40219  ORF Transcript_18472/g.40219 Transcript_18472/m.40219 type:complete len:238 (+) Transcript_18472:3374-4087(+)